MKRTVLAVAILALALGLTGCGRDKEKVAYRPIAFGQNNQCYYVHDPAEAVALQAAGLCERSWAPTLIPAAWHSMYYPYYSSPAYYRTYVPVPMHRAYVDTSRTWGSANKNAIATAVKDATYLGSNGKRVSAEKIGAAKYGGGARFGPPGTKFGGGARTATPNTNVPAQKPAATPTPPKATPSPKSTPPKSPSVKSPSTPKAPSSGTKSFGGGSGGGSKSFGGGGGRR